MKFYIAARVAKKEEVRDIYAKLNEMGHEVTLEWTEAGNLKPYKDSEKVRLHAENCIDGVVDSDVFVMITDEGGKGMYVEMGAAIHSNSRKSKPRVYVIGEHLNNSLFNFHPSVKRMETIDDVVNDVARYQPKKNT